MRKEQIYTQSVAAATWNIPLQEGVSASSVAVEVIRDDAGIRLFPDNDKVEDGVLILHFGLDAHAGTVRYSWVEDDEQQVVTDGAGNNVTITVTQNAGGTPSGSTF